jgi:hypothetical protein
MKTSRTVHAGRTAAAVGIALFMARPVFAQGGNPDHPPQLDSAAIERIFSAITSKRRVDDGIRFLENLRSSGFDNEKFLWMYAQYVFKAFIPAKTDSLPPLLKDASQIQCTDTAFPSAFSLRIISSQKAPLPFFEYRAGFILGKGLRLVFPPLRNHTQGRAWLNCRDHQPPLSALSMCLISQLSDPIDSAWCTIYIDLNDTKISPYEYLVKRIGGIYDSIEVKNDLPRYHALSLRCYSQGLFVEPGGTFTAYVVFDRSIRDILRNDSSVRGKPAQRWKTDGNVRFTLTMRCGCDVQDQAEAKLQSLLRSF